VPATIAVLDGVPHVGLEAGELERLAGTEGALKLSARDLPVAMAQGATGGTTVAATALLASQAGIRVFATGGIGGVHRNADTTFDESADLGILGSCRITVVSGGVKSILDVGATATDALLRDIRKEERTAGPSGSASTGRACTGRTRTGRASTGHDLPTQGTRGPEGAGHPHRRGVRRPEGQDPRRLTRSLVTLTRSYGVSAASVRGCLLATVESDGRAEHRSR
jgi:Indigoidine synthase A like protein